MPRALPLRGRPPGIETVGRRYGEHADVPSRFADHTSSGDSLVGDRALFAAVFDGRTNLGLVRWHSRESCERLGTLFQRIVERGDEPGAALPSDFGKDAAAALDKLF